jgi:hypothetical protein
MNGVEHGVPLGASKKDLVIIAQAESRADQRSHECNVLALTQLIESKQKWVASFTKLLQIPGMESEQKTKILDKVMELMEEIQADEKVLGQVSQNKRQKSQLVESFLMTGGNGADNNKTPSPEGGIPVTSTTDP